ncbi:hypothetical protein ACFO1B_22185 [Dactylosporangium siamense]|uniref:Uncharacterized protein n=1 Tax=Dactylosporangium siamense TaxID=685454 RepID=A0A919PUT0_9ACTN|nr:hypothetical protein [Dactylosporangium siamense]GIG50102.1 hypothetical protein Dsi01nite_081430 [Dactylosporangium siamense]
MTTWFVHRSPYDGPLSKRVRRLTDASVLDWFRRGWPRPDPRAWVRAELGGDVYGLDSIFVAAREHGLPRPRSTGELRDLLHAHLYVEGDEDHIRLDEHSLRVRTDDDEVDLAYYFLDDTALGAAPDRLAYLVHEAWPLPTDAVVAGPPVTYAVFLSHDGPIAGTPPVELPGVRLPDLAAHLRFADPRRHAGWPAALLVLRALVGPDEPGIDAALARCNRWPGFDHWDPPELPDEHGEAHRHALRVLEEGGTVGHRRPGASLLRVTDHLAQFAMHRGDGFGHVQWFLFDAAWAAAHPALARSLLCYAGHWDPLDGSG